MHFLTDNSAIVSAALVSLPAKIYIIRIPLLIAAYFAATNIDKILARVIGIAYLAIGGIAFLLAGVAGGAVVDILIGILCLAATLHAWWVTRV